MSSNDATKRRKVTTDNSGGIGGTTAVAGVEDIIAEMKVHMTRMQNEMETRIISMQNEMDGMKGRLSQMGELEKKNKYLEARCSSLERSVNILIQEQKWEYSAPDIPTSHWEERGYDEDYIECMEEFLDEIKRATCELRQDGIDNNLVYLGDYESDTALIHDDLLLPHWKELANAMQLYQEEEPLEFTIYNLQLPTSVIDLLKPVLNQKPTKYINLRNNSFVNVREGIEFAVEVMESNEMMQKFFWTSNSINSMDNVRYLVDAIVRHPSIHRIRLENCFGDDVNGCDVLRPLLASNKNFSFIDLDNNNIQTGGRTELPDYLSANPPLKELLFSGNNLNDDDARLIARALKRNTNLEVLFLYKNDFTEIGRDALRDAIYDPTSLNSIADCNHTCCIEGIDFDIVLGNLSGTTPLYNRRRKLYHLLSLRNREGSNVRHLNSEFGDEDEDEITLKLVPRVLECVHRYSNGYRPDTVRPLSITYEILRGWKMPELYEQR